MGLIINIIIIAVIAVVVTGAVAYNNPQKAKIWVVKGLQKFIPEVIDIKPDEIIRDFKNPLEEKEFKDDVPFPDTTSKKEILGRPRKVVEFFCTSDTQCKNYFLKSNAQCEMESGNCFIGG